MTTDGSATSTIIITTGRIITIESQLKLILLGALIVFLSAFRPARADDGVNVSGRALDLEFAAAVEVFVVRAQPAASNRQLAILIDRLDSDRYGDRERAGKELLAACTIPLRTPDFGVSASSEASVVRLLLRARVMERRPEVRYWLNRTLRALNRCETCDGAGYCAEYRPVAGETPAYAGAPCRKCGRTEWQHGLQWNPDGQYDHLACADCGGAGTHWIHYAVD